MVQDRGSGGCVPGGEGPQETETWSRTHYGKNACLSLLCVTVILTSEVLSLQVQYQLIFEALLVYLGSFDTYANF